MTIEVFSQRDLLQYLCTLTEETRIKLYSHELACRAVFRALPPAHRVLVFHLLGRSVSARDEQLVLLFKLNIVCKDGPQQAELHKVFLQGIRNTLTAMGEVSPTSPSTSPSLVNEVEEFARQRWDDVLHFLVHDEETNLLPPHPHQQQQHQVNAKRLKIAAPELNSAIKNALVELRFYDQRITSSGYEYILKDVFEEVWILLQSFLAKEREPSELLALLFSLSFKRPGDVVVTSLPMASTVLVGLGLLFPQPNGTFLVSSLGVFALLGPSRQRKLVGDQKFGLATMRIVVETTFKVYCYTTSKMHASMLELFCQLEARLPNLTVAMITRESVARAFQKGISAEQILSFLDQNADPITHTLRTKSVPDNVSDQISLWKKETSRLSLLNPGTLVECTNTSRQGEVFRELCSVLEGRILWTDDRCKLFVKDDSSSASAPIKDILKDVRAKLGV
ncbi:hypothetical protein BASA81_002088 [Batrachochytrium salamandrivorans]|nr:hypothetical protein BASA81_002088 [Batrachochytrium salamandrivorans]